MSILKKITLIITVSFLLTACPSPPCEIKDYGVISQEILDLLPYENQETYSFKHNSGQLVDFSCERYQEEQTFGCYDSHGGVGAKSERDVLRLTATYPAFHINFETNKGMDENDVAHYMITGRIQNSEVFYIPTPAENYSYEILNTITINAHNYTDVYKIPTEHRTDTSVYVDTLYYNTTKGILKLKMSNNEYYDINE